MRNIAIVLFSSTIGIFCHELTASKNFTKDVVKYLDFLEKVPFLSDLNSLDHSFVIDALQSSRFEKGSHIVEQGQPGNDFFIIVNGEADVFKKKSDGTDFEVVGHLGKHDYFGEVSLLLNRPRAATVVAKTPLECVKIDKSRFLNVMEIFNKIDVLKKNLSKYNLQ